MANGFKTGGRQKGVPNKATQWRQQEIAVSGVLPLDFLLAVMWDESQPPEIRIDAAKASAPYVHAKLSAVEMNANVNVNHEQVLDELE